MIPDQFHLAGVDNAYLEPDYSGRLLLKLPTAEGYRSGLVKFPRVTLVVAAAVAVSLLVVRGGAQEQTLRPDDAQMMQIRLALILALPQLHTIVIIVVVVVIVNGRPLFTKTCALH